MPYYMHYFKICISLFKANNKSIVFRNWYITYSLLEIKLWVLLTNKMTIGQFFILSPRGDTIINKDFRGDSIPGLQDLFFRKVEMSLANSSPFHSIS